MFGRKPTFLKVPRAQDITAYQEKGAGYRLLRRGSLLGFGIGLGLGLQHRSKRLPKSRSPVPAPSASVNSALSRTRLPVLTPSASISSVQRNTLSSTTRLLPLWEPQTEINTSFFNLLLALFEKWCTWLKIRNGLQKSETIISTDAKKLSSISAFQVPSDMSFSGAEDVSYLAMIQKGFLTNLILIFPTSCKITATSLEGMISVLEIGMRPIDRSVTGTSVTSRLPLISEPSLLPWVELTHLTQPITLPRSLIILEQTANLHSISYLLYEDVNGNAIWLMGLLAPPLLQVDWTNWRWTDLKIYERVSNEPLSGPLTVIFVLPRIRPTLV